MVDNVRDDSKTAEPVQSAEMTVANSEPAGGEGQEEQPQMNHADNVFQVTVNLPHEPFKTQVMLSTQEQVQDLRQSIIEQPHTFQYSCFHLEHKGERINDFVELSEVQGLNAESELTLVEDPYTEREARMHVIRVRELIGAAGDRPDTLYGILAGVSLHDGVTPIEPSPAANGAPPAKPEGPGASPMENYNFSSPGNLKTLLPQTQEPAPKTIKGLSISSWNPPPYHLRSKGHLMYLQITSNEGEQYQITSHIGGFYINKSTNNKFDPFPRQAPKDFSAHSLLNLISLISPSFESSFRALQEHNNKRDLLTIFQLSNAIPASPWIVPPPNSAATAHVADITRTQENYLISGIENTDNLRDWNEEFQSTREMAKEAVQDRVFRERLTSKLFADYNEAATRGAIMVARGEVAPLNPTESRDAQIFVYNNIFFSFGADGVGTFATEGGDEAARVATGKDLMGVKAVNNLDIQGLFTPGTVVVDYLGKRIVGQSIVPGIFKQREQGEHQIDYGGVEGKEVVATDPSFAPLFEKVSRLLRVKKHAVWDKEGVRHELEGSVETKGLLGTDGRKYALDLYRITPLDITWLESYWSEPDAAGETKDSEKNYPHRMTVLRNELVEAFGRQKLREYIDKQLAARAEAKKAEEEKKKEKNEEDSDDSEEDSDEDSDEDSEEDSEDSEEDSDEEEEAKEAKKAKKVKKAKKSETAETTDDKKDAADDRVEISGFQFALNPDVFSGQTPQTDEEKEEWTKDEADVRAACAFLITDAIPRLIQELQEGEVGFPMDGQSLSTLLHKRGINIRYLGKVATLSDKEEPRLQALKRLLVQEMISRGFKHVVNRRLRHLPVPLATACLSHLLNCLLGSELNASPVAEIDAYQKALYPEADLSFEKDTPKSIREEIAAQVKMRYRYDLGEAWIEPSKRMQMLREVSLKLGIQLETKGFAFEKSQLNGVSVGVNGTDSAQTNGNTSGGSSKKKKKGSDRSPDRTVSTPALPVQTFHPDYILNIVPVIKEASPKSVLAEEALEAGRLSVAQDQRELGQELLLESLSLHEQIYGVLHPEVARVYHQLSNLLYTLEEKTAAVELAHKAVIVSERTLGIDHAETVLNYLNLGLFEHATGNTKAALHYVRHALELWKVIYGPNHPDSITTLNNAAVMLQSMKLYHESRIWFEASLAVCEEVSGKQSINTATLLFQLSQALALDKDMHAAVNRMRESYNIFNSTLGPEDRNTKEAESWLEQLTQSAVSHAKFTRELQAKKVKRVNLTTRGTLKPQPNVGQSKEEAASGNVASKGPEGGFDQRSIEDLLKYIEGGDTPKATQKKRPTNPKRRAQRA